MTDQSRGANCFVTISEDNLLTIGRMEDGADFSMEDGADFSMEDETKNNNAEKSRQRREEKPHLLESRNKTAHMYYVTSNTPPKESRKSFYSNETDYGAARTEEEMG